LQTPPSTRGRGRGRGRGKKPVEEDDDIDEEDEEEMMMMEKPKAGNKKKVRIKTVLSSQCFQCILVQGWANYGLWAACGPPEYIMRPLGT